MARNSQLICNLQIIEILSGSKDGLTINELHQYLVDCGISLCTRTLRRHIDALIVGGFPMCEVGGPDATARRWKLNAAPTVNHNLVFSHREVLALWFARFFMERFRDSALAKDLETAFGKLGAVLGDRPTKVLAELDSGTGFEPGTKLASLPDPAILDPILRASSTKNVLRILYDSANSATRRYREIGPHGLHFADGSFYLVAECLESKTVKTFAVPRILEATVMDKTFESPGVKPEEWFAHSFGAYRGGAPETIKLVFAKHLAGYIKDRQWHSSQKVRELDDGRVELEMTVAVSPDLKRWVKGFGEDVEIITSSLRLDGV